MSCHSIAEVKDTSGNGAYVIEESKQYPFAFSDNAALAAVNRLLIRMEPSLHRKTFMKPFMRTPEFCSTCHKVALIPALNGYRWLRGQNHYDTWYDSGVSGRAVRSFYDPPKAKACRDCHLPDFKSAEFGNKNGYLHDHLFPAANTALPFIRQDAATQKRTEDFLKDKVLTVDLFAVRRENGELVVLGEMPSGRRPARRDPRRRGRRAHARHRASLYERHRRLERDLGLSRGCGGWTRLLRERRSRRDRTPRRGRRPAMDARHRRERRPHGSPPAAGHPRAALQQRDRAGRRARRPLPDDGPEGREGIGDPVRGDPLPQSSRATTRRSRWARRIRRCP